LVRDAAGNLYGSTSTGGSNYGTVYKVSKSSIVTLLHRFSGADGAQPYSDLLLDAKGVLYGTAFDGGTGCCGTVWRCTRRGRTKRANATF